MRRPLQEFRCVACKKFAPAASIHYGLCPFCRGDDTDALSGNYWEQGWTRDTREAYERTWPRLLVDLERLERFEGFLRRWLAARGRDD